MTRTLIVGDVHGCLEELDALLAETQLGREDRLVLVGDLVGKGPDSVGVVRRVRELGARSVLGNHDLAVVKACADPKADVKRSHREVASRLAPEEAEWLAGLPTYLLLPELDTLVVHAGVVPGVPLRQQRRKDLVTMRTLRPDGSPSSKLDEGELWARHWQGPPHVVFGHDAVSGLQRHPWATGLDTGCVYGGALTGLLLPERRLVAVRARAAYTES